MTKFSLGDIVASEMNTILDSEEHTRLFSKTAKKKEEKEEKEEKKDDKKDKKKEDKSEKKSDKKSDKKDKDEKEDKKSKKSESDKEDKGDKKAKKDKKEEKKSEKEMTSKSFEQLVNTFTKISHILDESGLPKSSLITLEALDTAIEELAVMKFAKEKCCDCESCGENCPCEKCSSCECMDANDADDVNDVTALEVLQSTPSDEPMGDLSDEIAELEGHPGTSLVEDLLSDPEAVQALNQKHNDERLTKELDKPEYLPFSMIESEPFDPEMGDADDSALLEELGLSPLDEDPDLSGVVSQRYRDAEKDVLGGHVGSDESSDTYIDELLNDQLGKTELPEAMEDLPLPSAKIPSFSDAFSQEQLRADRGERPTIPVGKNIEKMFEEDDVKNAFDKLDNWITKHAQDSWEEEVKKPEDEGPGFNYSGFGKKYPIKNFLGEDVMGSDYEPDVRMTGGDWKHFDDLSPEEKLEHEMGAGLHEQLEMDPDALSNEEVYPELFEEEDEMSGSPVSDDDYESDDPRFDADDEDFEDE